MKLKRLSIKGKIMLAVIAVVLVLAAVLTFYSVRQLDNIVTGEEEKSLYAVGDFMQRR
ncbi:MAG: hypothetical protein ACQEQG_06810 [Bacillota bacterium]